MTASLSHADEEAVSLCADDESLDPCDSVTAAVTSEPDQSVVAECLAAVEHLVESSCSATDANVSMVEVGSSVDPVTATAVQAGTSIAPAHRQDGTDPRGRRRTRDQLLRRQREQATWTMVLQQIEHAQARGLTLESAATALDLSPRTIRHWKQTGCQRHRRGRQTKCCPREVRQSIVYFLCQVGPFLGLEALRAIFPAVPRCVLADLLRRARRVWRHRYRRKGFRLEWHRPGAVWAIDFCDALYPIDGIYPYLFPVRDLASHRQLAWLPFRTQTAEETLRALVVLFEEHGCPLIIKCDNGSAFIADLFRAALAKFGVVILYSPPRCPAYNGGLERSNGTHKTYTQQQALTAGRPYRWTSEDTERARQLSNTLARPWGHQGPTPEENWNARMPLTADDRQQFDECLARHRVTARAELGFDDGSLVREDQARLDRKAVRDTLVELGYLTMTRVVRPAKTPKRRTGQQLAERVARVRAKNPQLLAASVKPAAHQFATATTAHKPAPAAPVETVPVVVRPSAPCPTVDDPLAPCSQKEMLVPSIPSDTMARDPRDELLSDSPRESETAQRESSHTPFTRRCLTLLVSVLKAAKITRG